ncbi:MAG: hypothetical protein A2Z14_16850 [Chloroflexi bacterium RBG_16_48_8]|nr:MAG: hypothetical protein A2Z14_16850 [Chloroflexi bacterium RBG_16_48_8]
MLERRKLRKLFSYFIVVFSLFTSLVTAITAAVIIGNYFKQRARRQIALSDPQAIMSKVEEIKGTVDKVEQLALEVESLRLAAIEAQQRAD